MRRKMKRCIVIYIRLQLQAGEIWVCELPWPLIQLSCCLGDSFLIAFEGIYVI